VHGNQTVRKTSINAARTCVFAGLDHVDVVEGAAAPLVRSARPCPEIHGDSGLDGTALLPPGDHPAVQARLARWRGRKAAIVMAEEILKVPGPVTLVATGALTNVALALLLYGDELKAKLTRIVIMGGAVGVGNINPVAEFNILCDPEAAHVVYEAGSQVVAVPSIPFMPSIRITQPTQSLARVGAVRTPSSSRRFRKQALSWWLFLPSTSCISLTKACVTFKNREADPVLSFVTTGLSASTHTAPKDSN
jgi:hypothetical protein